MCSGRCLKYLRHELGVNSMHTFLPTGHPGFPVRLRCLSAWRRLKFSKFGCRLQKRCQTAHMSCLTSVQEQVKALQGNPTEGDRDMMQAQHKARSCSVIMVNWYPWVPKNTLEVAAAAREQVAEKAAAKAGAKKRKQKAVAKEKEEPAAKQPKTASDGEIDADDEKKMKAKKNTKMKSPSAHANPGCRQPLQKNLHH